MVNTKLSLDVEDVSKELESIIDALDGMNNLNFTHIFDRAIAYPAYSYKNAEQIVTDYLHLLFNHLLYSSAVFRNRGMEEIPVDVVITIPAVNTLIPSPKVN
jgi:hypothetical protein